jgi:hypothetical protein
MKLAQYFYHFPSLPSSPFCDFLAPHPASTLRGIRQQAFGLGTLALTLVIEWESP